MPLMRGSSNAIVSDNVRELRNSGYPERQAVAIALSKAGKSNRKKKRKSRKRAETPGESGDI